MNVYEDPLTGKVLEGHAVLVKYLHVMTDKLEYWDVLFDDDPSETTWPRWIRKTGRSRT